ncbi:adenylyl-sulfate kinase [Aeropyrum pernix]|uniref:adenylyl-sulfate kinase n=1 Tax=Aeropyrum pernix TaxID=56636 RepID=UPI001FB4C435|nr:adenylyl-sulfate kinase [Aeropyrum pernix]
MRSSCSSAGRRGGRHIKRIAWIARLLARNGVIVVCSFVSPYRQARNMVRRIVEEEGIAFPTYRDF